MIRDHITRGEGKENEKEGKLKVKIIQPIHSHS